MIGSFKAKLKLVAYNIGRAMSNDRSQHRVISKFANKFGLNYIGGISQNSDDHQIIRGFTVSQSHQDSHYCVGEVDGYNVTLVDRSDAVWGEKEEITVQNWLIMSFDLKTKQDLPHIFIKSRDHSPKAYETFFKAFPTIHEVNLGTFEKYSPEFISRFALYSRPNMAIKVEKLLPVSSTRVLGAHFWPLSAEQNEHKLYIYSSNQRVTSSLLETMLKNGLWLAAHLDHQVELV